MSSAQNNDNSGAADAPSASNAPQASTSPSASNATVPQQSTEPSGSNAHEASNATVAQQSTGPSGSGDHGKPLPRGYEIKGLAKPGDYDHVDMYEGINLNENMENAFRLVYLRMLDLWERGQAAAAEAEANRLLGWGKVPVLYRAYAHIVSFVIHLPVVPQEIASGKGLLGFLLGHSAWPESIVLLDKSL